MENIKEQIEEAPKEWPCGPWLYCENEGISWIIKSESIVGDKVFYKEGYISNGYTSIETVVFPPYIKRVATKEDIESIMAPVLEKMGYKEGVTVITPIGKCNYILDSSPIYYDKHDDEIYLGNYLIYCEGQFATIVETKVSVNGLAELVGLDPNFPLEETKPADMFTQEDYKRIYESLQFHSDGHALDICKKLQSLIQPDIEPPLIGSVYMYEGVLIGYCLKVNGWNATFDCDYSSQISIAKTVINKQDWSKLVLLKPVK